MSRHTWWARMNTNLVAAGIVASTVLAMPSLASADWYTCDVRTIAHYSNRIQVRCNVPFPEFTYSGTEYNIEYVTMLTSDAKVDRFLAMATSAMLSGLGFMVEIHQNPATISGGCSSNLTCRGVGVFSIVE
jgi:hypothetical protein